MPPKKGKDEPPEEPPAEEAPVEEEEEPEETELSTGLKLTLKEKDVERLWACPEDFDGQSRILLEVLQLEEIYPSALQRELVCDFYIYNLSHAKSICLTPRQGAIFHAIMDSILVMMKCDQQQGPSVRPQDMCTAATCFKAFEKLILDHSVNAPDAQPPKLDIFRGSEARLLADFASTTLFKHFLLYQYCISFDREVETLRFSMSLERPLAAPDLNDKSVKAEKPKLRSNSPGGFRTRSSMDALLESQGGAGAEGGSAEQEQEELTEEEQIDRMVQEKLKETAAKLQEKLEAREEQLKEKLASMQKK
eukprot:gnl/TRDRNA2_/TRDRNA2_37284_c0_seq1.p1 gnl/TRDRNA2_/TRDRNA2_37284_c0~~gnl/TRDRNA2_/TRDRNA2_37284_c0_seq1.p1  ORF type:complete len:348 (+),score=98.53 gnl/TRDRNA2_/TRDRNA2_37284_c0_seq1:126-1046(+)